MTKEFTLQFIKENCGCYREQKGKLKQVYEDNGKECFDEKECAATLAEIFASKIPTKDKYWFLTTNALTKEENQQLAILALDLFLETFNKEYSSIKEVADYVAVAKEYVYDKVSNDDLWKSYRIAREKIDDAHGGWVLDSVAYYCTAADVGFGCSKNGYYLLARLSDYESAKNKLFDIVIDFIK